MRSYFLKYIFNRCFANTSLFEGTCFYRLVTCIVARISLDLLVVSYYQILTMYFRVVFPMTKRETQNCKPFCGAETNYSTIRECECASRGDFCGHREYVNRRLYRRNKTDIINCLVIICLILTSHSAVTTANIMGDECDWFGR
jgi:hypothetical protein